MQGRLEFVSIEPAIPIAVELLKQLVQIGRSIMVAEAPIAKALPAAVGPALTCTLSRTTSFSFTVTPFAVSPDATTSAFSHLLTHFGPFLIVQFTVAIGIEFLQHLFPHFHPPLRPVSPRGGLLSTIGPNGVRLLLGMQRTGRQQWQKNRHRKKGANPSAPHA
jgi:hypothetical protein